MDKVDIKDRIKEAMELREINQTELSKKANIDKGQLSSYIAGKYKPRQNNIEALSIALDVNEAWLMGFDVPMEKDSYAQFSSPSTIGFEITARSLKYSPEIFKDLCDSIKNIDVANNMTISDGDTVFDSVYDLLTSPLVSYEKKAIFLRTMIDFVIYDTKKEKLFVLYDSGKNESKQVLENILQNCHNLTLEGLHKIEEYTSDISSVNSYLKPSTEENSFLNAAHENSPTFKQKNDADNIMMNDDEWE